MKEDRLRHLLHQHIQGDLLPQQLDEMFALIEELGYDRYEQILDQLVNDLPVNRANSITSAQKSKLITDVLEQVGKKQKPSYKVISLLKWAAAITVLLSTSLLIWRYMQDGIPSNTEKQIAASSADIYLTQDSLPQLTLPDGRKFAVDEKSKSQLANLGFNVHFETDNSIQIQAIPGKIDQQELCFSTPKGYTSKIQLADGSKIWLNSNTKLFYPAAFTGAERRVRLEGEAYFEVSHNANKPFYVEMNLGSVKVLGTSFNISSYASMPQATTTLLTGKVEIHNATEKMILKPEEQAILSSNVTTIQKKQVNVIEHTAWMHDFYFFNDKTIQEILLSIQNWYDIDAVDIKIANNELYTGTLKRSKSLKSLLAHLEKLSNLKIELQGRRIVVMK